MGIEPTWPAWKAGALPLSYARNWWGEQDSNLRRRRQQIYSLSPLATRVSPRLYLELAVGFEPTTCGLQNRRSAVELR